MSAYTYEQASGMVGDVFVPLVGQVSVMPDEGPLARSIRARRQELKLRQEDLFDWGLEQSYVSMVERGKIRQPTLGMLERFSAALDMPLDDLALLAGRAVEVEAAHSGPGVMLPDRGAVPMSRREWLERSEDRGQMVEVPSAWASLSSSPLFAVHVPHDCFKERLGIVTGDIVVCAAWTGDCPKDGELVLVRVGATYDLQIVGATDEGLHEGEIIGVYIGKRMSG